MEIEESWGDEWSDDEVDYGDDYDQYEDDEWDDSYTIACPACGSEVYEDAEQCPGCGEYIVASSLNSQYAWRERPLWWIVLGAAGIAAVLWVLVF